MEGAACSFKLIVPVKVHCVTSQKTIIFIFTVMRISDITQKMGIVKSCSESIKIRELVYFSMKIESRESKRVTKERKKEKMGIDILNLKQPFLVVHLLHKLWVTCSYSHSLWVFVMRFLKMRNIAVITVLLPDWMLVNLSEVWNVL